MVRVIKSRMKKIVNVRSWIDWAQDRVLNEPPDCLIQVFVYMCSVHCCQALHAGNLAPHLDYVTDQYEQKGHGWRKCGLKRRYVCRGQSFNMIP